MGTINFDNNSKLDNLIAPTPAFHKKIHHIQCYYCGIIHDQVEASGMWYCPNPVCGGPGASWFRKELDSYEVNNSGSHRVSIEELSDRALEYMKDKPALHLQVLERQKINKEIQKRRVEEIF